jgi:hypothetical protein
LHNFGLRVFGFLSAVGIRTSEFRINIPLKDGTRLAVTPGGAARMIRALAKKVLVEDSV